MHDDLSLHDLLAQMASRDHHDPEDRLVRQIARLRARDACEYCLHPTSGRFEVDHIIPAALWGDYSAGGFGEALLPVPGRRGPHHLENYAWSCPFCNLGKRQRVMQRVGSQLVRLFDPRRDQWRAHFRFLNNHLFIAGITPVGVATQHALGFNAGDIGGPLGARHDSIVSGRYPPPWFDRLG